MEPDDRLLGDRRVDHASLTELVDQAVEAVEHPTGAADVLARYEDIGVGLHGLAQPFGEGMQIGELSLAHVPTSV
jgi:hypothetical protein